MPLQSDNPSTTAVQLLKGAALAFALIGGGMAAWGLDKWIRYPEARATQFGFEAPLWPAFTIFVFAATVVGVLLLWTAAGRVADGENLFAQRHRRRSSGPDDLPDPPDPTTEPNP
ncbi:MAG: ABC transporter permease [Salinibacter sp.]